MTSRTLAYRPFRAVSRRLNPYEPSIVKGGRWPLVRDALRLARDGQAKAAVDVVTSDMATLMERLGGQPTDPAPFASSRYVTEAAAVQGCATNGLGGALLHGTIRALRPRQMIEIGAAHGYGACYIAHAMSLNGVGHLRTLEGMGVRISLARETVQRLGFAERVDVIGGDFADTLPASLDDLTELDFVFSDGGKELEQTHAEFRACVGAMTAGGHLFFDDINFDADVSALWQTIVSHERIVRGATFRSRWALLEVAPA